MAELGKNPSTGCFHKQPGRSADASSTNHYSGLSDIDSNNMDYRDKTRCHRSLNITKLEVDNNSEQLHAIISLGIRVSNKNEKMEILYGPLFVDVISEEVALGNAIVEGFSQKAQNDTNLDMQMTISNAKVDRDAVESLKSDIDSKEMVFDVYVGGHIGFKIGSMHMTNVPFLSSCHEIKQMDVDFGRRPACDVKMFSFR
ncbi:hypothetical protein Lal_00001151 [Lupinus albus]|nr:hypothetical protein Lal_00001151 [Lupinus albus]